MITMWTPAAEDKCIRELRLQTENQRLDLKHPGTRHDIP